MLPLQKESSESKRMELWLVGDRITAKRILEVHKVDLLTIDLLGNPQGYWRSRMFPGNISNELFFQAGLEPLLR